MKNHDDFARDERMASLIADLTGIATGWRPESRMLEGYPVLEQWRWTTYPGTADPALTGIVRGHPIHADGRPIVTSPVLAFGLTGHWARTVSRFYRLGTRCSNA